MYVWHDALKSQRFPFLIDFRNYKFREGKMKSLLNKQMFREDNLDLAA
jgi:hypothetical protein